MRPVARQRAVYTLAVLHEGSPQEHAGPTAKIERKVPPNGRYNLRP